MYLDNTNTSRSGWRYTYKGAEMLSFTKTKLAIACSQEKEARELVIRLTRDPNTNPADQKVEEAKRTVVKSATLVEELMVFTHEFARNPERDYSLSMGDVVFFGLIDEDIQLETRKFITPGN